MKGKLEGGRERQDNDGEVGGREDNEGGVGQGRGRITK